MKQSIRSCQRHSEGLLLHSSDILSALLESFESLSAILFHLWLALLMIWSLCTPPSLSVYLSNCKTPISMFLDDNTQADVVESSCHTSYPAGK